MFDSVRIVESIDYDGLRKVNRLLEVGWKLLAVPQIGDAEYQSFVYVLGWVGQESPPVTSDSIDREEREREQRKLDEYTSQFNVDKPYNKGE